MKFYRLFTFLLFTTIVTIFAQQETQCQGVEILYPKADAIIDRTKDQYTYLILGNISQKNSKLTQVSLLHKKDGNEIENQVWKGQDELLKVSAIQQDLNKLDSADLPNRFWFRVSIQQQNGIVCQYESGRFKVNSS